MKICKETFGMKGRKHSSMILKAIKNIVQGKSKSTGEPYEPEFLEVFF
jgi:hypothetical protein